MSTVWYCWSASLLAKILIWNGSLSVRRWESNMLPAARFIFARLVDFITPKTRIKVNVIDVPWSRSIKTIVIYVIRMFLSQFYYMQRQTQKLTLIMTFRMNHFPRMNSNAFRRGYAFRQHKAYRIGATLTGVYYTPICISKYVYKSGKWCWIYKSLYHFTSVYPLESD